MNHQLVMKEQKILALKEQISQCTLCANLGSKSLINPHSTDEISIKKRPYFLEYWSDTTRNWNAEYMIIGQDWGSIEYASCAPFIPGGFDPQNPTDILLNKAIANAQIEDKVHVTNSTICLRRGHLSGQENFSEKSPRNCLPFLRSQIEIIQPKIIITLGKLVTSLFLDLPASKKFENVAYTLTSAKGFQNTRIFPIYHLGTLGQANRSHVKKFDWPAENDLVKLKELLEASSALDYVEDFAE